jgi:hypothetical protein
VKRFTLLLIPFIAFFAVSCSGGGGGSTPPPPTGGFANSSLKGQYAFIMTGQAPDGFIARIGSFTADGSGGISGGLEIVSTATNALQILQFTASNYSVQADGRGAINLTNLTGTISFSITMTSTTSGYISQTDGITGTSGTFELQDSSAFTPTAINGPFVFDTSGLDPNGNVDSIVGQFTLNSQTIPTGVFDENVDATLSGPQTITNGTYFLDSTNGSTVGLGQMSFGGFLYDFIIVNSRKIHLIEVPGTGSDLPITIGTAIGQTAAPTTNAAFNGSYAFLTSGVGTTTFDFKAGRFTANNGSLSAIAMDEKLLGDSITQIPKGTLSAMTYDVDQNFPGSGRVTISFLDSSNSKPYQFIAYMASASQGVIQDNGPGIVGDGQILAQTSGPFSNSSVAGDYGFNWTGVSNNNTNNTTGEEDFVGHVTVTSAASNNTTGAMDYSELNLVDPAKVGIHNAPLSGVLTINGDGTTSTGNRNTVSVNATNPNGGPSSTFNFNLYPVNSSTMFVIETDKDHCTGGTFTRQITPP